MAWPKVWPKFRIARRSRSRSSLRDHDGLYLARPADRILQRLGIPRQQLVNVAVQPIEQQRIPDAAVLDHLGEA